MPMATRGVGYGAAARVTSLQRTRPGRESRATRSRRGSRTSRERPSRSGASPSKPGGSAVNAQERAPRHEATRSLRELLVGTHDQCAAFPQSLREVPGDLMLERGVEVRESEVPAQDKVERAVRGSVADVVRDDRHEPAKHWSEVVLVA